MPRARTVAVALAGLALLAAPAAGATGDAYDLPAGTGPYDIAVAHSEEVWFTAPDLGAVGRLRTDGQMRLITEGIGPGAEPSGIVADGSTIWYADPARDVLGRISTHGESATEFPTGLGAGAGPFDLARGTDDKMWFTAPDAGVIGRVPPTGSPVEVLDVLPEGAAPLRITSGPGGMWFTDYDRDVVGRISLSGVLTEYPVPGAGPIGISSGSDPAVWFAAYDANSIGRVTASGAVTLFPLPGGPGPVEVARDEEGFIWFLRDGATSPGRISLDGQVLPALTFAGGEPADAPLASLDARADGVWATSPSGDRIVQITLDPPAPPVAPSAPFMLPARPVRGPFRPPAVGPPATIAVEPATNVGPTSATINILVSGHTGTTSLRLDYGPTRAYGARAELGVLASVSASARISRRLTGLVAGTTYHFHLTATNTTPGSPSAIATGSFTTVTLPRLTRLRATTAAVTLRSATPGSLRLVVSRPGRPGRPLATIVRRLTAPGAVRIALRGPAARLAPGAYRVRVTLTGPAGRTATATARLVVPPRRR